MKKIAQFIIMSVTSAISIFALFVILFRIDLVIDLFNTKPILLLIGITIGATVGFLVGTLATYNKLNTELNTKKSELNEVRKELREAKCYLKKVLPRVIAIQELQKATAAEEAKHDADKRSRQIFSEITELSEETVSTEATPISEEATADDDEGPYGAI